MLDHRQNVRVVVELVGDSIHQLLHQVAPQAAFFAVVERGADVGCGDRGGVEGLSLVGDRDAIAGLLTEQLR